MAACARRDQLAVTPAQLLWPVLRAGWPQFVVVHTHPGGGQPSFADHAFTRRLVAASVVLGVRLVAHLLLTPAGTYAVSGQLRQVERRADRCIA